MERFFFSNDRACGFARDEEQGTVKKRLILGVVILVVGVLFAGVSYQMNGAPWGFRDRDAVFVEVVGTAEVYPSRLRKQRERIEKTSLPGVASGSLFVGDEVRVSAFSMARAVLPHAEVELLDGANVVLEKERWMLKRGLMQIKVLPGKNSFIVGSTVGTARLDPGTFRLTSDGSAGGFFVFVEEGTAFVESSDGKSETAENGELLMLTSAGVKVLDGKAKVSLTSRCKREGADAVSATRVISGKSDRGTQIFINGKLTYPDEKGKYLSRLPPGDRVVIFARSAAGSSKRVTLKCGSR
ncbi:MAG: hypothetical protein GY822_30380 [Deltaproteobacteria bacterium]|nr:hypothetical protein [Deltaproteobacteria bacterium]